MSEAKFTPGPWVIEGNDLFGEDDGYTVHIAEIHINYEDNGFGTENAHLIAAAPELYEALEDVLGLVTLEFEESPMVAFAKAALTKARGEE